MLRIVEPQFILCDNDVYGRMVQCMEELDLRCTVVVLGQPVEGVIHANDLLTALDDTNFM